MKVTVNVSKKALFMIGICCVLGISILTAISVKEFIRTKDYVKVQSLIVSVEKKMEYGKRHGEKTSINKIITEEYEINGKKYTCRYRTFWTLGKKAGSSHVIYCDRFHPEDVRNTFLLECCVLGGSIFLFVLIFVLLAVKQL